MRKTAVLGLLAVGVLTVRPPDVASGADRYGGIWHPGKGTGLFVPLSAGMTWGDVLSYRQSWGAANSFRITDIEVVPKGCPSDRRDLFATQWEEGTWADKLYVVSSISAVQNALSNECRLGYRLKDFEIWDSDCSEPVKYILLFRQDGKPCSKTPILASQASSKFGGLVSNYVSLGYTLADFEIVPGASNDPTILGAWYPGPSTQKFEVLDREAFEAEMTAQEGHMTLMHMESFRRQVGQFPVPSWWRYVAGLWETLPGTNADDHEVGEVYPKFKDLVYKEPSQRQLVDFEVYPDTNDDRFGQALNSHLAGVTGGYAVAVIQAGEVVATHAVGYARRPAEGNLGMTVDVRGPVLSVTKFFTALGVLRYAETKPDPNAWLDTPMTQHLPPDFVSFGPGVSTVTLRELLTQKTGLAEFTPSGSPVDDPVGWREQMKSFLSQPLADPTKAYQYQNIHFDLLALLMEEVELPPIVNSAHRWSDWMNQQVFAKAGVGPFLCGGTAADALSYPLNVVEPGLQWNDGNWDCAGSGTGAAMFWASTLDLARVNAAFRAGKIVSPAMVSMVLAQGLGLDPDYPDNDGSPDTIGEELYKKSGRICSYSGSHSAGSETLIARFDDYNFDDDPMSPLAPQTNDSPYEVGYRDFDIGIMVHSTPYAGECFTDRIYPSLRKMLREAVLKKENW